MQLIKSVHTGSFSHQDAEDMLCGHRAIPTFVFGYRDPSTSSIISFFQDAHPDAPLGKGQSRVTADAIGNLMGTTEMNGDDPLMNTQEQYRVLCLSTDHLRSADRIFLDQMAEDEDCGMIMARDTGYFIKLYDEVDYNREFSPLSQGLMDLLVRARVAGYRMIEFDLDAPQIAQLETFTVTHA